MRRKMNKKGFTLIELVIVIAVIGILATVAMPVVGNIINDARASADEAQVALLQMVMERYKVDEGSYPTGANESEKKTAAIGAIQTYTNIDVSSGSIPDPKQNGMNFYYNDTTGQVSVKASAGTGEVKLND